MRPCKDDDFVIHLECQDRAVVASPGGVRLRAQRVVVRARLARRRPWERRATSGAMSCCTVGAPAGAAAAASGSARNEQTRGIHRRTRAATIRGGSPVRQRPRRSRCVVVPSRRPGRIDSVARHLRAPLEERVVVRPVHAHPGVEELVARGGGRERLAGEARRALEGSELQAGPMGERGHLSAYRGAGDVARLERVPGSREAVNANPPGGAADHDRAVGRGRRRRPGRRRCESGAPGRSPRRRRAPWCRRAPAWRRLSCG